MSSVSFTYAQPPEKPHYFLTQVEGTRYRVKDLGEMTDLEKFMVVVLIVFVYILIEFPRILLALLIV